MTELVFLGTKGEIEENSPKHAYHSSLFLRYEGDSLLIDYGVLHKFRPEDINPSAILITHAHPDHYVWLKEDIRTEIPVYLTMETLEYGKFRPENHKVITPGEKFKIGGVECLAYRVIHSIRCPAVGYKLKIGQKTLVYNSDLVDIVEKDSVLTGVDYYIGDGSGIRANLVRRRGDQLFGHTRITTQINWCKKYGINHIIFTHLGKETIEKEAEFKQEHPDITLAYDGMELTLS